MSTYRTTSAKRILGAIACAVLCCLTTVAFTLFGAPSDSGYSVPPVAGANSASASAPHRNYTDITAELFSPDVVFYNGFSTGYGIKENLKVTGSYNGKVYALTPDEFYVTADGLGEIELLDFATNPQTLSITVNVPSGGNTLTAKTDITIADKADVPASFTTVTVAGASSVSADNTYDTIKNAITVKLDGATVNRELYSVTSLALTAGSTGSATLTFEDGSTKNVTFATVTPTSVQGIAMTVSPSLKYESGYYKNGEYSAFVNGMPFFDDDAKPSVFASIDVYVFYDNSSEKAGFTVSGNTVKVALANNSFKNVVASASGSTAAGSNNITLTVTLDTGASFTDSITLPFENKVVVDIEPTYNNLSAVVYSYTSIDNIKNYITVVPVYNDGAKEGELTANVNYTGTLTPTSEELGKHDESETNWTYDKEITVSYTTAQGITVSRNVTVSGIIYQKPTKVNAINKPMQAATQTMTYDFDYTGFYFEARYSGTTRANYYLSDISYDSRLPIYKEIVYYDDSLTEIKSADNTVPKDAVYAEIKVHYFKTELEADVDFIPEQAPVDYPAPSEFVKDYDENCVITISGEAKYMDYIALSPADDATRSHVDIRKTQDGNYELAFNAGGDYYVKAVITDGADGVYRFKDVIGESNIEKTGQYTVTYHFVINKGEFELSLEYATKTDEWVYGGAPGAPVVKGKLGGREYTIKNQSSQNGLAVGEIGVPYLLYYYGFGGRTYDDIVGKSYGEIAALASTLPKNVGDYYVVAVTEETDAYAQSTAFRWNAHVVKITPKPLTLGIVNGAVYTRGSSYEANDVINTSSFVTGDSIDGVLSVTTTEATPFTHAGSYNIVITLTNNNYKWDSGVTTVAGDNTKANAKFTISKRELDFKITSIDGFTYGDRPAAGEAVIDLDPIFEYQSASGGVFAPSDSYFYAIVNTDAPKFYRAAADGTKIGTTPIDLTTSPMNKWAAGKYYVEFSTSVDVTNGDNAGDYNLPTAGIAFDVKRKQLAAPAFTAALGTYDGDVHNITIDGYDDIVSALVNDEKFTDIFSVKITAKRLDGNNVYSDSGETISSSFISRTYGVISVTEAGGYQVTVAFKAAAPNYEWKVADDTLNDEQRETEALKAQESARYDLYRRTLAINGGNDGNGKDWTYKYDGDAHTPVITLTAVTGHSAAPTAKVYTDDECTDEIAAADVTEVGDYRIKVADYAVTKDGADVKANYRLPSETVFAFNITAAELHAPVLSDRTLGDAVVSTVYTGAEFYIGDFIEKWSTDFQAGGEDKLNVIVFAGDSPYGTLKNVYNEGDDVAAYKVYLYPTENYSWDDGVDTTAVPKLPEPAPEIVTPAYAIDFIITRLEVELKWSDLETAYNENEQSPTVVIDNKVSGDDVSVVIGYTYKGSYREKAISAGKYKAYAKALDGADKGNYQVTEKIVGEEGGNPNYFADFTVTKKILAKPSLPTGADNTFNGTSGKYTVTGSVWSDYQDKNNNNILKVTVSGVVPADWFTPPASATVENITDATFNVKTGALSYTRAGEYAFTVELLDHDNYCFDKKDDSEFDYPAPDSYVYTAANKFTVNRKKLSAPNIALKRAQEWDKGVKAIEFGSSVSGVAYAVKYGNQGDAAPTSTEWLGFEADGVYGKRGVYYAELTLSASNALNYVWVENTADTGASNNGLGYVPAYATYYYNSSAVAIRLYYAITSSQIDVDVKVASYTFGDNGLVDGARGNASFEADDELVADQTKTVYISGRGVDDLIEKGIAATLSDVKFVIFGTETIVGDGELVNGLPWTVGKYTLCAALTFGDGKTYAGQDVRVDFEVMSRAISVTWSDTSFVYEHKSRMATATINTVVKRSETDKTDYTDGLKLVVKMANGDPDPVNKGDYTVKVTAITAAGTTNNFKLPATDITTTLSISAKAVTVTGASVTAHVYRDEIAASEKKSDASDVFYADGAASKIQVTIKDGAGKEIDRSAAVGGAYKVVVGWTADAGVHADNYLVTFEDGSFTIVQRTLTVELNADNARSVYGDTVDLYDPAKPIYTVTACKGGDDVTDALGGLSVTDVFRFTCSASESSPVGAYDITHTVADDGFNVAFTGEWKYVIAPADITDNGTIQGIGDTTYKAADINVLKNNFAVTTKKNATAKWYYAFVDSASATESSVQKWTEFNASPAVYHAGVYHMFVKVTADNHNALVKLVTVKVAKAELTVKVDFSIMYGEGDPVAEKYKMKLSDLRTNGGVYTVIGLLRDDGALFYSADPNEKFYNLTGDVEYTVSGYTDVTTYRVYFTEGKLSCDNYTFKAAVGTLTVNKINLTVDIKNQEIVYHAATFAQPDLTVEGENGAYKVTLPKSTYDDTQDIVLPDGHTYTDIFKLSSAAITDKYDLGDGRYASTAGVGKYAIIGENKLSDYYEITFAGDWDQVGEYKNKAGIYEITPASLDMSDIDGIDIFYDEQEHGLVVVDKSGNPTDVIATAADCSAVTVLYYESDAIVDHFGDDDLAELGDGSPIMPKYINVGSYYVVYKVTAANHTANAACRKLSIKYTQNSLVTPFAFANGKQFASDVASIADGDAAWVYGLFGEGSTDGYNKDGDQAVVEPAARFNRLADGSANALSFRLSYSATLNGSYVTVIGNRPSAAAIFADGFSGGLFKAGYYRLIVSMPKADPNYDALSATWVFKVARRDLTVSAEDVYIMFGDDADAFVGSYEGLVLNSTASGAAVDTITDAIGDTLSITTAYKTGDPVNTYVIAVTGGTSVNYDVTYVDAELHVSQREVTITINNQESTYNLQNENAGKTLTFKIVGSTLFYKVTVPELGLYNNDNQSVIKLYTEALDGSNNISTNKVLIEDGVIGSYTIYARYANEFAKENYNIKFASCDMSDTRDGAIVQDGVNNAGAYKINQATLKINYKGIYHIDDGKEIFSYFYSGEKNYYKAVIDDDPTITVGFDYYKDENGVLTSLGGDGVVDAGEYVAYARLDNTNYKPVSDDSRNTFTILKTTLVIKAKDTTIQFGTPLPTDSGKSERFGGFEFTTKSQMQATVDGESGYHEMLTKTTLEKYLTDHPVAFKADDYNPKVGAGQTKNITPVCASSANVDVWVEPGSMSVVRRNVTVTVVGWDIANDGDDTAHNSEAWCYYQGVQKDTQDRLDEQFKNNLAKFIKVDVTATFGFSGDKLADLLVKLSLPSGAVNVVAGGYGMTVESAAANYNINFITSKTADGVTQNRIEYNADDAPVFMIEKAPLTLYANSKNGANAEAYSVVYGSSIKLEYEKDGTLDYAVDGLKNGDLLSNLLLNNGKLTYAVMCGAKAYSPWESSTQEAYVVSIAVSPLSGEGSVEFDNYEITAYKTAALGIAKLTIKASTVSQVFQKAADGYHGGVYGKSHEAVITFSGVNESAIDAQKINDTYRPKDFTLTYSTVNDANINQSAYKAPTAVGNYTVTVALKSNGNYTFAGGLSVTLPFSVTKRTISDSELKWSRTLIGIEEESLYENKINNFVSDIMTINSFMFNSEYGTGRPIGQDSTADEHYELGANGGLTLHFGTARGTYEINFSLKSSATRNYEFAGSHGSVVVSTFAVTGDTVNMTVAIADFTYRDTPSAPEVTINGSTVTEGLIFTYGKVVDTSNISEYIGKGDGFGGFDEEDLSGLEYDGPKALSAFDAGYYVLYAYHSSSHQSKYYVFCVRQKEIGAPVVSGDKPSVYNGRSQQFTLEYDLSTVRATYAGTSVQNANGSTFYATYADDYTISFMLVDPANYKWADAVEGVTDGVLSYTWTINRDDAESDIDDPYISLPTVSTLTFGQTPARSTATVRAGYEGNVDYYYVSKAVCSAPTVGDTSWTFGLPSDADEYWIKAVVSDGNDNFTDKATIASLIINKKEITATAFYTMTYGDNWSADKFEYRVDGLLYGNKVTEVAELQASMAEEYGKLVAGGEYYITLGHDGDGVALGLDAGNNYVIKAVPGPLTVVKRDVTVTIGSLSGYYTVTPDVSRVGYTVFNLASGDDKSALGIAFTTDATNDSNVNGQYWITAASYDDSNYNVVAFERGVYTVKQLAISVALTEQTGLVYGDGGIVGATMGAITCDIPDADIDKVRGDLKLSFTYTGKSFGGEDYNGNTAPSAAGNYVATLVGVNDNYALIGSAYVEFTIAKRTVDAGALSIANQPYSGKALTPVVKDGVYGSDIYSVASDTFTDAGSHQVWLTLVDGNNYRWNSTDEARLSLTFVIDKIADGIDGALVINGWQYGGYDAGANSPSAVVKSGENVIYQYSADGVTYTSVVPENGNAGSYYVRVYVAESKNYLEFVSAPVKFEIARRVVVSPSLTIVTEGKGKNDVYTGSDLSSAIVGFNPQLMQIAYDGSMQALGENVVVYAHDADVYRVSISLFNARNYCWSVGDADNDGTIELEWTVARKKVAKPTHDSSAKIVNGNTIVYLPIGFDESVMAIENNAYSYGGTFTAKITLKDTKNYEWATDGVDGDVAPFTIKWTIVGADSVFAAIISVLSVLAVAGAALMLVQFLLFKRRKRATANAMRDIEMSESQAQAEQDEAHAEGEQVESEGNKGGEQ